MKLRYGSSLGLVVIVAMAMAMALATTGCSSTISTSGPGDLADRSSLSVSPTATAPIEGVASTGQSPDEDPNAPATAVAEDSIEPLHLPVQTGASRLADSDFEEFSGMTVGLIVNQTSLVEGVHLIDVVNESANVELGAIFAPEHGVRGIADAGELVSDDIDATTGITIFSLYGTTRKPSLDMLDRIDALFYDLQDVGTRHYTYISTMGLAMQTAAEAGIPFVVLDRPNPLGGLQIFGPVLEETLTSFIGRYPIPSGYGLTAAELAQAIKGEGWLEGLEDLDLRIIQMQGWERSMLWPDTGLDWVAPSPGLPSFESALLYPGTVLIESTELSYGAGTPSPFSSIGATWIDSEALAEDLNQAGLEGIEFEAVTFVPAVIANIAPNPRLQGLQLHGVRLVPTSPASIDPFLVGLELLSAIAQQASAAGLGSTITSGQIFDLLTGSTQLRQDLQAGVEPWEILASLEEDLVAFDQLRQQYLLY